MEKDKEEAREPNTIAQKEEEDRIDEMNKTATKLQQITNAILSKMVEMQSDLII